MIEAYTQETTIQPGGKVTVESPDLPVGAKVRVVVLVERPAAPTPQSGEPRPLSSFIGTGRGGFKSVREVDEYIRAERDAWDR